MGIPHYIHYCWFGDKKLPKEYMKYIRTWSKFFPDYTVIRWDKNNFPISEFKYAKEAAKEGKWAFVSDVARIYALKKYGGIYLDTDVEIIKNFEDLLEKKDAVLGVESVSEDTIGTGFMAMSNSYYLIDELIHYYKETSFYKPNGELNQYPNTHLIAKYIKKRYSFFPTNEVTIYDDLVIYPEDYFTAFNGETGKNVITNNTRCIHHFGASWHTPYERFKAKIRYIVNSVKC